MAVKKNLGRRFYKLTVVGDQVVDGVAYYICECLCGKTVLIQKRNIADSLSCGCAKYTFQRQHARRLGIGAPVTDPTPTRPLTHRRGWINENGYRMCWVGKERTPSGYMLEHRALMERKLGRVLERWEEVHHKNTVRTDNRDENLELWVFGKQPKGGRVSDLIDYANWVLDRYGNIGLNNKTDNLV